MQHNKVVRKRVCSYHFGSVTLWSVRHFLLGRCCFAFSSAGVFV